MRFNGLILGGKLVIPGCNESEPGYRDSFDLAFLIVAALHRQSLATAGDEQYLQSFGQRLGLEGNQWQGIVLYLIPLEDLLSRNLGQEQFIPALLNRMAEVAAKTLEKPRCESFPPGHKLTHCGPMRYLKEQAKRALSHSWKGPGGTRRTDPAGFRGKSAKETGWSVTVESKKGAKVSAVDQALAKGLSASWLMEKGGLQPIIEDQGLTMEQLPGLLDELRASGPVDEKIADAILDKMQSGESRLAACV